MATTGGTDRLALLGAGGTMGFAMAKNLARAGFEVRAWNRTLARAAPLADHGVTIAATPAEAAEGADVVITMLSDADAVLGAMDGEHGALSGAGEGALWLQMSTVGIAGTERCAALAGRWGASFVDAPVLGTKEPAEQGKLVVLASGPDVLRQRLRPIFDAVGQRAMWVGEAGGGTRLKLVANSWILAVVEGTAETVALAEGLGLDPGLFFEAVAGGPLDLPYLQNKGGAMAARSFEPSFRLALAAKDAALVEEAAGRHELDLPLLAAVRRRLDQAVPEHGDKDMSATFLTSAPSRERAGASGGEGAAE
jgi:3-hydroxyisobutyrate dehydrogenase